MPLTLNSLTMDEVQAVIDTLQTDVTALQVEDAVFDKNIRAVVAVDMLNADYTLTLDEANSNVLVVSNSGDGTKTLTWPTTSDASRPAQQLVVTIFCSNGFTIAAQSGGGTDTLVAGTVHLVSVPDGLGAINVDEYIQIETRKQSNGVSGLSAGANVFNDASGGLLLIGSDAAPQTVDIALGNDMSNLTAVVYCTGAGGITIQGDVGVTVSGNTTLASGESCRIYRDALTETYYCV